MREEDRTRQVRSIATQFETREEEDGAKHLRGYFAVFDSIYEIAPGMTESIAPGAFSRTLSGDIRALINHDTTLVLGRTKAGTLAVKEDAHGLYGDVTVNPNDQDAVNCWERVQRGDVDQCSFGFEIVSEDTEYRDDGSIHWTIKEVKLHEVSVCTFPAYEETNVSARSAERDAMKERRLETWKHQQRKRLKGAEENGT